jgi:ABC-type phosphate/phosphonate transport system substrate-binding protein
VVSLKKLIPPLAGALLLVATTAHADRPVLHLAFTVTDNSLVDPASAHAAAAPLVRRLGQMAGERVTFAYVPKSEALLEEMKARRVNFAITSSLVYVQLAAELELQPLTLAQTAGKSRFQLQLLVQSSSPIRKVAQLRGKSISINRRHRSGWMFLENQLRRARAGVPSAFFGQIRSPLRTKSVILDLLMGEVDGCVTSDAAISAMAKLNSQVKTRFRVVAHSSPLATPVLFAAKGAPAVEKLRNVALRLHKDTVGRQLLMVFRIERMVPVDKGAFETQRAMVEEHEKRTKPAQDKGRRTR